MNNLDSRFDYMRQKLTRVITRNEAKPDITDVKKLEKELFQFGKTEQCNYLRKKAHIVLRG